MIVAKMGEPSQKAIKIDGILWDELDRWLQTPQAQKLGFHSKAQFTTQAVKELLEQNMKGKSQEYGKIIRKLNSIESKLDKTLGIQPTKEKTVHEKGSVRTS